MIKSTPSDVISYRILLCTELQNPSDRIVLGKVLNRERLSRAVHAFVSPIIETLYRE
jgi:hypothetical protein